MKGILFNVQRYSLHDGGGIRTLVFFKGCPLTCPWCCNPESRAGGIQLSEVSKGSIRGTFCKSIKGEDPKVQIGQEVTVDEIIKIVERDRVFYKTSNGGVTLSGGEILNQAKFATNVAKELKKLGVNVAIETSGSGSKSSLLELCKYVDTVLFDLKIMDKAKCKDIINGDIDSITDNFRTLVMEGHKVIPRIPLIPGYTDSQENLDSILKLVKELDLKEVHILPFHQYGSGKYEYLNMKYNLKDVKPPTKEEIQKVEEVFTKNKINVVIGGE